MRAGPSARSARHRIDGLPLQSGGLGFEAKMAFNALEEGFEYQRMQGLQALLAIPFRLKNFVWSKLKQRRPAGAKPVAPSSSEGGFTFDPAWIGKRSSLFSRLIMKTVSRKRMGALRRRNYLKLADAVRDLPGIRPMHAALPDGVYPWVFPVLVDDMSLFGRLKMEGVPIIRFAEYLLPGVDASVCANSVHLSQNAMQFPCHQELRDDELDWMIARIRHALQPSTGKTT